MDIQQVGIETAKLAATAAFSFGTGALCGEIMGASPVAMGVATVANSVAITIFNKINDYCAEKFNWSLATHQIFIALGATLFGTATVVSLFALGVIGPIGAGVMGGSLALGLLLQAGIAVYLKETGEDCPYSDVKQMNPNEWTVVQKLAMA